MAEEQLTEKPSLTLLPGKPTLDQLTDLLRHLTGASRRRKRSRNRGRCWGNGNSTTAWDDGRPPARNVANTGANL
jgi:hypothetical protein